jgi:cytoskeletal protein CcmA (bactofilin family)
MNFKPTAKDSFYSKMLIASLFAVVGIAWSFGAPEVAYGATIRVDESYTLEKETLLEGDLYTVGKSVAVGGDVRGDVFSLATNADFSGLVEEDVFLVGGRVTLTGVVAGDARIVGGTVTVSGEIEEDLVIVGGTVRIAENTTVRGGLFVFADHLILEGVVQGPIEVRARTFDMRGKAEDRVTVVVRDAFSVTNDAVIDAELTYTAPRSALISGTATVTGQIHPTILGPVTDERGGDVGVYVMQMIIFVASSLLFVFIFPRVGACITQGALTKGSGVRASIGFVALFSIPVFAVVSMMTLVLIPFGILMLFSYIALLALSIVLAPVCAGAILSYWVTKGRESTSYVWVAIGAIVIVLLPLVPVIGQLVRFLLFVLVLGSLLQYVYTSWWPLRRIAVKETAPKEAPTSHEQGQSSTETTDSSNEKGVE